MAITLGTAYNSGNLTTSSGTTLSVTTPANSKCLVAIITSYDSSATDSVANTVRFGGVDLIQARRYRSGSGTVMIWYLSNPSITTANLVVTMAGTNTDLQVTALGLISAAASIIVFDNFNEGATAATTSHAVIVNPAKIGSMGLGGIVAETAAITGLDVTASYGTEITGSEADMGSQVVGCAYRAESGGTCEIRWTKTSSISFALVATFVEKSWISGTCDNISDVTATGLLMEYITGISDSFSDVTGIGLLKIYGAGTSDGISDVTASGLLKIHGVGTSDSSSVVTAFLTGKGGLFGISLPALNHCNAWYDPYTSGSQMIEPANPYYFSLLRFHGETLQKISLKFFNTNSYVTSIRLEIWTVDQFDKTPISFLASSDIIPITTIDGSWYKFSFPDTVLTGLYSLKVIMVNHTYPEGYYAGVCQSPQNNQPSRLKTLYWYSPLSRWNMVSSNLLWYILELKDTPEYASGTLTPRYFLSGTINSGFITSSGLLTTINSIYGTVAYTLNTGCISGTLIGKGILGLSGTIGINLNTAGIPRVSLSLLGTINILLSLTGNADVSIQTNLSGTIGINLNTAGIPRVSLSLLGTINIDIISSGQLHGKVLTTGIIDINLNIISSEILNIKRLFGIIDSGCQPTEVIKSNYGNLYNWYVTADNRGICPTGWHIPSSAEFITLQTFLGGELVAGGKLKKTGFTNWSSPNIGATNESGFTGVGSGQRNNSNGDFGGLNEIDSFWCSNEMSSEIGWQANGLQYNETWFPVNSGSQKKQGSSIRLMKDDSIWTPGDTITDYDGNIYPTIKIGTQVWIADNLIVEHYNNGDIIPNVTDNIAWSNLTVGALCYYQNNLNYAHPDPVNYTECITGTLTGKQTFGISGAINIDLSQSGSIKSAVPLTGALNIDLAQSASLKGSGKFTGALNIDLATSGQLSAKGSLRGVAEAYTQDTGTLRGQGSLSSNINVNLGFSGSAAGSGNLTGNLNIDLDVTAQPTTKGSLSGAININLDASGSASGQGYLSSSLNIDLDTSGTANGSGKFIGALNIDVSQSGLLGAVVPVTGALNIDVALDGYATATAPTGLSGLINIDLALSANAGIRLPLSGAINIALGLSGSANVKGKLSGTVESGCQPLGKTSIYGNLYNWYAATDARGIAPAGWHVPTQAQFNTLITNAGGSSVAGGHLRESGTTYWNAPNTGADNSTGFSARGSGRVDHISGGLEFRGFGDLQSATNYDAANSISLSILVSGVSSYVQFGNKNIGYAIRLMKNDSTDPGTMTDYDGNVYNTVKIGSQVWMKESLIVEHYNNGDAIPIPSIAGWIGLTTGAMRYANDDQSLAYSANYTECITGTLTGKQTLGLSGAINIDVSLSANATLTYANDLSGAINIDLDLAGNTTESGQLSGALNVNLDLSGDATLADATTLSGNINISLDLSGSAKISLPLSGAINVNLSLTGSANIKGKLSGTIESGCQPLGKTVQYGALYNWKAATNVKGIAPAGWRLPTRTEFETLSTYLGGDSVSGGHLKEDGIIYWSVDNADNSSGFSARGSGYRVNTGEFIGFKQASFIRTSHAYLWESEQMNTVRGFSTATTLTDIQQAASTLGYSIRLIKTDSTDPGIMTDYDGNIYNTVKIGTQVWMKENLMVTHYSNGDVIPEVTDNTAWAGLITGALCYYNNDQSLAYSANYTECVTGTLTGINGTLLSGAITIDLALAGNLLTGTGLFGAINIDLDIEPSNIKPTASLSGTINIDLDASGSLSSRAPLSGAINIDLDVSAQAKTTGSLSGAINIDMDLSGSTSAAGSLSSSINIDLDVTASLTSRGSLSGAINIDLDLSGQPAGSAHTTGTININIDVVGWAIMDTILVGESDGITNTTATLKGAGLMIGAINIDIDTTATMLVFARMAGAINIDLTIPSTNISGYFGMSGSIIITVGIDGVTRLLSALNGLLGIGLDTTGLILGFANIDGILELDVGLQGNLTALYGINGGLIIDVDLAGEITPLAKRRILLIS